MSSSRMLPASSSGCAHHLPSSPYSCGPSCVTPSLDPWSSSLSFSFTGCSSSTLDSPFVYNCLPFDLSEFCDSSTNPWGFSVLTRAYFQFLNYRTILLSAEEHNECVLNSSEKLQRLLDLLMQVRPYANDMVVASSGRRWTMS